MCHLPCEHVICGALKVNQPAISNQYEHTKTSEHTTHPVDMSCSQGSQSAIDYRLSITSLRSNTLSMSILLHFTPLHYLYPHLISLLLYFIYHAILYPTTLHYLYPCLLLTTLHYTALHFLYPFHYLPHSIIYHTTLYYPPCTVLYTTLPLFMSIIYHTTLHYTTLHYLHPFNYLSHHYLSHYTTLHYTTLCLHR